MKTADKDKGETTLDKLKAKAAKKQRAQLIILGSLSLLLAWVLIGQFGSEKIPSIASPTEGVARAMTAGAGEADAADEAAAVVEANSVLSQPLAEFGGDGAGVESDGLGTDPFAAFWNTATEVEETDVKLEPPSMMLKATLTSERLPVAVIDGRMQFVGDVIQGWTLDEIRERAIVLRAPSNETYTIEMPILFGRITTPPVVGDIVPAAILSANPVDDSLTEVEGHAGASAPAVVLPTNSSGPLADDDSH